MKFFFTLIFLSSIIYGIWWTAESHPNLKDQVTKLIPTHSYTSFEPRFTANQIMKSTQPNPESKHEQFGECSLTFYPFLLMEVKFTRSDFSTGEGIILWDLIDGEMVLDTETWEKSHGFADCINVHADHYELKILNILAKNENEASRHILSQEMNMENATLDHWLDRCLKKKLIVHHQGVYRIHLEKPKMHFIPITDIKIPLITKTSKHPEKLKKHFSSTQVMRTAEAAFGSNFAIRQARDVYLPIYCTKLKNKDGSFQSIYWNSLNGKQLAHSSALHE